MHTSKIGKIIIISSLENDTDILLHLHGQTAYHNIGKWIV